MINLLKVAICSAEALARLRDLHLVSFTLSGVNENIKPLIQNQLFDGSRKRIHPTQGESSPERSVAALRSMKETGEMAFLLVPRLYGLSMLWERCTKQNASFQRRPPILKTRHVRDAGMPYRTRAHFRAYFAGTTCRLLVTEKIPGTLLARRVTMFLSASLSTTPSKVT